MKQQRISLLVLALVSLSASVGSAQDAAEAARRAQVIARGEGFEITIGKVEDAIAMQSPFVRAKYKDVAAQTELVQSMVRFEMLSAEARRRGYDKDPQAQKSLKQTAVQTMIKSVVDDTITPDSIPAEEVKAYYDGHPNEFHRDGLMRASHVLVNSKARAEQIAAQVKKADAKQFRDIAQAESLDTETKLRGGDLHYFDTSGIPMRLMARFAKNLNDVPAKDRVAPELTKAAFALKEVGDVSKPIKVGENWSVLRLTGTRPAEHKTLAESDTTIRQKLWRDKRREALDGLVDKLRAEIKPEIHEELLKPIKFEAPAATGEAPTSAGTAAMGHAGHGHAPGAPGAPVGPSTAAEAPSSN